MYWFCHTSTWIRHECTCVHGCTRVYILNPTPISLPIPSLWVIPVHHPEHPVSCIEPGLVIHFTYNNLHVSMPFSHIIPPSPSPTELSSNEMDEIVAYHKILYGHPSKLTHWDKFVPLTFVEKSKSFSSELSMYVCMSLSLFMGLFI